MSISEHDPRTPLPFREGYSDVQFSKNGITVTGTGPYYVNDGIHAPRKFTSVHEALSAAERKASIRRETTRFRRMGKKQKFHK